MAPAARQPRVRILGRSQAGPADRQPAGLVPDPAAAARAAARWRARRSAWRIGGWILALSALLVLPHYWWTAGLGLGALLCFAAARSAGRPLAVPTRRPPAAAPAPPAGRIRVLGRLSPLIVRRSGPQKCPAGCGQPLLESEAKAVCTHTPGHMVHRQCGVMMQQKCPICGNRLR